MVYSDAVLAPPESEGLRCARCGARITDEQEATAVNGSHTHTLFNPAGLIFELRCFRQAPGAVAHGEPTDDFTWFAGYRWQTVFCAGCENHLGWLFTGTDTFHALITRHLV